jgi:hypothetical protein
MGWTGDSTVVTADSTLFTADGGGGLTSSATPYLNLITSEHNQKPNFMAMVGVVTGAIADVNNGIQAIQPAFDLDQAIGAQLDILGLWIGQSRVISDILILGFFGFADDVAALPFGEFSNPSIGGVFYEFGSSFAGSTVLSDADYLTILRARIVRNQSDGTLEAIENALQFIFGVNCSVADNGTMNLAITVSSPITPTDQALLSNLDILPRPAGVEIGSITYTP